MKFIVNHSNTFRKTLLDLFQERIASLARFQVLDRNIVLFHFPKSRNLQLVLHEMIVFGKAKAAV